MEVLGGPCFWLGRWGVSQESCTHFCLPAPVTSWPPTLLTEFIIFCLHLLLIPVTVVVIVRVMLHVLEAETGHIRHMRTHLLGAPVGGMGGRLCWTGRRR